MRLVTSPRFWALVFAGGWSVVWVWAAIPFFSSGRVEVLWVLAIFSTPSSLVLSELSHGIAQLLGLSQSTKFHIDLFGFLLFGWLQYGVIGYVFGKLAQRGYSAYLRGSAAQ